MCPSRQAIAHPKSGPRWWIPSRLSCVGKITPDLYERQFILLRCSGWHGTGTCKGYVGHDAGHYCVIRRSRYDCIEWNSTTRPGKCKDIKFQQPSQLSNLIDYACAGSWCSFYQRLWGSRSWCRNIVSKCSLIWWQKSGVTISRSWLAVTSQKILDWMAQDAFTRFFQRPKDFRSTAGRQRQSYKFCKTKTKIIWFQKAGRDFLAGIGANIGGGSRRMPELCCILLEVTASNPTRSFR